MTDNYTEERINLAATFRWAARLNMHEGIANHFSLAVSSDGSQFLLNPYGKHWSQIKASDLLLLDANDLSTLDRKDVDSTAFSIHGAIHRNHPGARCLMHVHPKYSTALASLKDSTMLPIDQNTMRFYNRVAIDDGFDGMGLGDEAERLSNTLGNKKFLLMGNHGIMATGTSVAQVFDELYYYERAAETLMTAYATGKELRIASPEVAEKTATQFEEYLDFCDLHLQAIRDILDKEEPEYRH